MLGSQGGRGIQKMATFAKALRNCVVGAKTRPETWLVMGSKSQDSSDKEAFLLGNGGEPMRIGA